MNDFVPFYPLFFLLHKLHFYLCVWVCALFCAVYLCLYGWVCMSLLCLHLSSLIGCFSFTGSGKRVCFVSAAPVDWPYFRLQAAWPWGRACSQCLSPPDLRGLRQPRQPRLWPSAAWGTKTQWHHCCTDTQLFKLVLLFSHLWSLLMSNSGCRGNWIHHILHIIPHLSELMNWPYMRINFQDMYSNY